MFLFLFFIFFDIVVYGYSLVRINCRGCNSVYFINCYYLYYKRLLFYLFMCTPIIIYSLYQLVDYNSYVTSQMSKITLQHIISLYFYCNFPAKGDATINIGLLRCATSVLLVCKFPSIPTLAQFYSPHYMFTNGGMLA